MKTTLSFLVVALVASVAAGEISAQVQWQFDQFNLRYNKSYTSDAHFQERLAIFNNNMARAAELNEENPDATFGITKFSDLTFEEFSSRFNGFQRRKFNDAARAATDVYKSANVTAVPTSFDWRSKGAITPVKDQGGCGSCWAFSATEELESAWFLAGHSLPKLSPQQVVSCDKYDGGCNGGDLPSAYDYIKKAGGLESERSYPYTGRDSRCKFDSSQIVASIKKYTYATPPCTGGSCSNQDENTLKANIASYGPAAICVNANDAWQTYQRGVISSGCSGGWRDLDHCVQLVGYESDSNGGYWLVRNSWNTDWGVDGYIHLRMGKNICGVADEAIFAHA